MLCCTVVLTTDRIQKKTTTVGYVKKLKWEGVIIEFWNFHPQCVMWRWETWEATFVFFSVSSDKLCALQLVVWVLRGVSRVAYANNPLTGALILAALYWESPWQCLLGTLGVLTSTITAVVLGQDRWCSPLWKQMLAAGKSICLWILNFAPAPKRPCAI